MREITMRDNSMNKTLVPRLSSRAFASLMSGLLALGFVGLVAYGVALIYVPAGWIAAGAGCLALQYQFFGER